MLKKTFRYLKSTIEYSLVYSKDINQNTKLIGYSDSDYASNIEDRKSTSGYLFKYGNCVISWHSSKQKIVSLSSTESEYIALTNATKELLWIQQILNELNRKFETPVIYVDNKSSICLEMNLEFHSRSKHLDVRHHFRRKKLKEKEFVLIFLNQKI